MLVRISIVCPLLVVVAAALALCDEPPSWQPFERCSANERFCARIEPLGGTTGSPRSRSYVLRVTGADGARVWSSPYSYDGYVGGYLSNDGAYFVYVSFWYYPAHPVVTIYSKRGRSSLSGVVFSIREEDLIRTASHHVWLEQRREPVEFVDSEKISITTIDGRVHTIDLETAVVSSK
ncbi:MAG: hypothetical protein MJE66_05360 [Proteobacteria bacterium]|nr:hypothetical protein [Pseudomonadota bacterium]